MSRRLIEEELPLAAVNAASAKEKSYTPRGHLSTLHLWWARRPIAMSRAVVYGSVMPSGDSYEERNELLTALAAAASFEESGQTGRLTELVGRHWPEPPRVLDCFAGGGTIPLEAMRLGCETHAVDLNPIAHLVELAALDFPMRFVETDDFGRSQLVVDFEHWSRWIAEEAEKRLAEYFPRPFEGRPAIYLWCRTMACPGPLRPPGAAH